MKAFAFVLLCALAAVQGRYTGLQSTRSAAALGENPWLVHLRIAVSTSGLLETCAGSLIDNRWVLTAASCVASSRFIWVRYGVVNVINPSLVTESTAVRFNPEIDVGLVSINRYVWPTDNIAPISLLGKLGDSATVCVFGGQDGPGEVLSCYNVEISEEDGGLSVSSDELKPSKYDVGAALVSDGVQVGILADESGKVLETAGFIPWIERETGLVLNPEAVPDFTTEANPEVTTEDVPEVTTEAVHFV